MPDLPLEAFPPLPQIPQLVALARALWQDPAVIALWLGGSLARAAGDAYSDVDLRIAVAPDTFRADYLPAAGRAFVGSAVAHVAFPFGPDAVLHHLLLPDGTLYDLLIQTTARPPTPETRLVLGCRDATFAANLEAGSEPEIVFPPATGDVVLRILTDFWMGQQKHLRVLYRQLPLLSWDGEHRLRHELVRLWFIAASGQDCGPVGRLTIHTFTPVARAVAAETAPAKFSQLGQAVGSASELIAAAQWSQAEAARVGRQLTARYSIEYPAQLEATVKQSWAAYLEAASHSET